MLYFRADSYYNCWEIAARKTDKSLRGDAHSPRRALVPSLPGSGRSVLSFFGTPFLTDRCIVNQGHNLLYVLWDFALECASGCVGGVYGVLSGVIYQQVQLSFPTTAIRRGSLFPNICNKISGYSNMCNKNQQP